MRPLAIYLHWPFCTSKCPYCDFNSHVAARIDEADWRRAYLAEIARYGAELPDRTVTSIFLGGGTPSLMSPGLVGDVLNAIQRAWPMANDVEITLEANPGSVEAARFTGFRLAGVNRISLGVQALNDADLKRLGRLHSAVDALTALDVARAEFDRTSFDLIYARQDQTLAAWDAELRQALAFAPDHLSLYQLTIEPGTAFGDRFAVGKLHGLPDEDRAADMWDVTQTLTRAAGLPPYEVSNHARAGAESRHNLTYWRGGDWIGIGPGAHGRFADGDRIATEAHRSPAKWLTLDGHEERTPVDPREEAEIRLMMGLRLTEGIDVMDIERTLGALDTAGLERQGLVSRAGPRLAPTEAGRPILNGILREILVG